MLKPIASNGTKTVSPDSFLADLPDDQRDFYAEIFRYLPKGYHLSTKGISHTPGVGRPPVPFCSPFRVKQLVQEPSTKDWTRVVELLNPIGEIVDCVIPEGKLTGSPREAISLLSDRGLRVHNDREIAIILALVRNWEVSFDAHLTLIERVGWTSDRDAFILPTGRVIRRSGTSLKYSFGGDRNGKEIGDLKVWRERVASLAPGNPNLVFGIALGFSTALMPFTKLNTLIFHLFQATSRGKTLVLRTALSVWPKIGDEEKTWDGTGNGLEGEIAKSNNILLGLDELRAKSTPDLSEIIYKFANSSTKARGKKEGGPQNRETWKTNVISTGELSFVETLRELGATATGGQRVRMLDIPAEGTYGIFDVLHGFETGNAFVDGLEDVLDEAAGPAGAAFVEHLLDLPTKELKKVTRSAMGDYTQNLQEHLEIIADDEKSSEIGRVLKSFALVATAGEWATRWGLTGWEPGTAEEAVKTIARRWLDNRLRMPTHQSEELEAVRDYIAANDTLFIPLSAAKSTLGGDALGYQDDAFFYILPATFEGLVGDKTKVTKTLNALVGGGYLEKGGENKSLQYRLPSVVPGRPRAYRIRRSILSFKETPETTATDTKE